MTCGIYKLNFKGTEEVYIGQSLNIEMRYTSHKCSFIKDSSSAKLMHAYRLYGMPQLEILTECSTEELNEFETETIEIFNSVDKGFNTLANADSIPRGIGDKNPKAKFSNEQIEQVFHLLVDTPNIRFPQVSEITGVPVSNIRKISCGDNHSWLSLKYPEKYNILRELRGSRRSHSRLRTTTHLPVISPEGKIYHIINVKEFCIEHHLDASHLGSVLKGKEKQHKGWKLYNDQ